MQTMLRDRLKGYQLILASGSPRRQEFLKEMGLDFTVDVRPIRETYPKDLQGSEISDYLVVCKAKVFEGTLGPRDILITADTVVWHQGRSLAKAENAEEARDMLRALANNRHQVITSVCFVFNGEYKVINEMTEVRFGMITDDEINYYVQHYGPYDKAGAYGIQEWIGLVGVAEINGSYTNVVGFPTYKVYQTLGLLVP